MTRSLGLALLLCLGLSPAFAQGGGAATTVGGMTNEVCVSPTVTASAYTSGNSLGGLLTFSLAWRNPDSTGAPEPGGIVQSVRATFKSVQTTEVDAYQFTSIPSNSTWTDKSTPAINSLDVSKVRPPIKMTNNSSGLGTHTVYGSDGIGRAQVNATRTDYWVIVVIGTPTPGSTSDFTFCVTYLMD